MGRTYAQDMTQLVFKLEFSLEDNVFIARSTSDDLKVRAPTVTELESTLRDTVCARIADQPAQPSEIVVRVGGQAFISIPLDEQDGSLP